MLLLSSPPESGKRHYLFCKVLVRMRVYVKVLV